MEKEVATPAASPMLGSADLVWLDTLKPELVGRAEDFLDENPIYLPAGGGNKARVSVSQLRNLLAAAQSGSPFAVLVNFLRYQIGRGNRGWGDLDSGEALVHHLNAKELSKKGLPSLEALTAPRAGKDKAVHYLLESQVAAQFFGFLIREFTYRCKREGTLPT